MRRCLSCLSLLVVAAGAAPAFAQGPFTQADMIDVSQIAIVGDNRADFPMRITDDGQVFGYTFASPGPNASNWKTWRFTASGGAVDIGLTGDPFVNPVTGSTFAYGQYFTSTGQVAGTQGRNEFTGVDAFYFDGVNTRQIGLLPTEYPFLPASYSNYPVALDETGVTIGVANALIDSLIPFSDGRLAVVNLGWYSRNGVTEPMGLSGSEFIDPQTGQRNSFPYAIAGDFIVGQSERLAGSTEQDLRSLGSVGWVFNLATNSYTTIELTGPRYVNEAEGYTGQTLPAYATASGVVAGLAVGVPGQFATGTWMLENGVLSEVGLIGPRYSFESTSSTSAIYGLNANGVALGVTDVQSSINLPASRASWVASNGVTRRIGPATAEFTDDVRGEYVYPQYFTNSGFAGGFAAVLPQAGEAFGQARAWVQNTADVTDEAVVLGLTDDLHTADAGQQYSLLTGLNEQGAALGVSFQYRPEVIVGQPNFGYTAWVYDSAAETFTVIPAPATANGLVDCIGFTITPRGGVVGFYLKAETPDGGDYRPFYWSPRAGFVDLMADATIGFSLPEIFGTPIAVSPDGTRVALGARLLTGDPALLRIRAVDDNPSACDSIDFNNNQVFPEDQDVIDFFNTLSGAECEGCNDIDFNNNGVFPEDQDVIDFFNTLAGGSC
jgi:hypothetical protein